MKSNLNLVVIFSLVLLVVTISGCTYNIPFFNYLDSIPQSDVSSYNASCAQPSLNELVKNPDSFFGKKIKASGTIFQIWENWDGTTNIILDMPESYSYVDRVYITYNGKIPFVKGDNITAYGEGGGKYSYESVEDYDITLPLLKAVYIE